MKNLNINTKLKNFNGAPVVIINDEPINIKDALLQQVGAFNAGKDGKKTIQAYSLGLKISQHTNDPLELEEAEFDLLKETLKVPAYSTIVMAPVLMEIERAENKEE